MKTSKLLPHALLLAMLLAMPVFVSAQEFNGSIELNSQAEVDAFDGTITEIYGTLTIGSRNASSDITNLAPLSSLTKVGLDYAHDKSTVYIVNNHQLKNLHGLENLTIIIGGLEIDNNQSLTSLQGLENLTTLNHINIWNNDQFQSFQGVDNLHTIGEFSIINNNKLQNLNGLENFKSQGTGVNLSILDNDELENFKGLSKFTSIYGLFVSNNYKLQSFQGLNNLNTINQDVKIWDNPSLKSLTGLENLESIEGGFWIRNSPNLNDCCAIASVLSKVKGDIRLSGGPNCSSVAAIQGDDCTSLITGFTLVDATTDEDIADLNPFGTTEVINILETGDQLNIRVNTFPEMVGSVVFELDGKIFGTENVAPFALAGDAPPGDYFSWTPSLGNHSLTAIPYEGKKATGKRGKTQLINFVVLNQPLVVTGFTLISTVNNVDLFELVNGSYISLEKYDYTGLNIRANTYGEVGSVVFDFVETKNYRTENLPPFALGGDAPPGQYFNTPELKSNLGFYELIATPYSEPKGQGMAGLAHSIKFIVSAYRSNHILDYMLVDAETNEDIMVIRNGRTIDLDMFSASGFNIRAVTYPEELEENGKVVFVYDGIANFRTERVPPYALGGDINGDYMPFPLSTGKHVLTGNALPDDIDVGRKSITFFIKNGNQAVARKTSVAPTKKKEVTVETEDLRATLSQVQVIAYPNPTESILEIQVGGQADSKAPVSMQLYDQLGEKVWEGKLKADHTVQIDVGHLPSGVYFLKAVSPSFLQINRVIVR